MDLRQHHGRNLGGSSDELGSSLRDVQILTATSPLRVIRMTCTTLTSTVSPRHTRHCC